MSETKIIVLTTREDPRGLFPECLTIGEHDAFTFIIAFDPKRHQAENHREEIYMRLEGMYSVGEVVKCTYNPFTHQGGIVLSHERAQPPGTILSLISLEEALTG